MNLIEKLKESLKITGKQDDAQKSRILSTPLLTLLLSLFFIISVTVLFFVLYMSNGGSNEKTAKSSFYSTSSSVTTSTSQTTSSQETETTESSAETSTSSSSANSTGKTLTVQSGEGAGSIAARAGISVSKLYELNPDKMVGPGGTWWANPGDTVNVN